MSILNVLTPLSIYRLKVVRLRKDYEATREGHLYPKLNYEVFLDTLVDENLGFFSPAPCNKEVHGYWVSNKRYHLLENSFQLRDKCDNAGVKRGVSVKHHITVSGDHAEELCVSLFTRFIMFYLYFYLFNPFINWTGLRR